MLEVLIPLFISIVSGIIVKEINAHDWGSALAVKIIDHVVIGRLPEAWRFRLKEEWLAEIENIPSDFQKVRYALSLIAGAGRIQRNYQPATDQEMMDSTEKWTGGQVDDKAFFESIAAWVEQRETSSNLKIRRMFDVIAVIIVLSATFRAFITYNAHDIYLFFAWLLGLLGLILSYIRWCARIR